MRPNFWRSMGLLTGSFHGNSVLILQLGFHPYRGRILTRKFGFCCHLLIQLTSHDDVDSGFGLEWETSHCSFSLVFGAPALPSEAAPGRVGSAVQCQAVPRSKHLLISWLQSPSAVILEHQKNKVWHCFHCFPIYFPWSDGARCHGLHFLNVEL